jgi:hypothetical protein
VKQIRYPDEHVEYLLTVLRNGGTREAAGGAIYLFGLVPDFALFTRDAATNLNRISRNRQRCEKLSDLNQPLQKRLQSLGLKPDTLQQPLFHFFRLRHTEEPRVWGRAVACDAANRHLSFDRWEFVDSENEGELRIILDPLNLPRQRADEVAGADRMPVLNVTGRDPLKVAFRSIPNSSQAPAWKNWRVQILALGEGGAAVAWESNSYPKPARGRLAKVRRSIKSKDLEVLDEGTYFLRVDAYDLEGALLTTPRRIDPKDETSRAENESEPFLVVREEVVIDGPEVRATFVPSLLAAWLRGTLKALDGKTRESVPSLNLTGLWNQPIGTSVKGDVCFDLETEGFQGFSVVVPGLLRKVEVAFLDNPRAVGAYAMKLNQARTPGDIELECKEQANFDGFPNAERFLLVREEVFRRIREQHLPPGAMPEERADRLGIIEVIDLASHADAIQAYAQAFVELVHGAMELDAAQRSGLLRGISWLDTVELRWQRQPGDPGRGILLAPTHPLRLLWHLQHSKECARAIEAWDQRTYQVPDWRHFVEQLHDELLPLNLPMALFDRRGRAYTEALPVTPFWGLYLPDRDYDGRHVDTTAARGRVLAGMGVRARSVAVTTIKPDDIAARLFEFVQQHPYIDQLRLNVFNPGTGELIADVLRGVEALRRDQRWPSSLRYAVHLFAPLRQLDTVGEAVEGLLDPERHVGEDDEFTLYSGNHLHPKLLVARNDVADFVSDHTRFPAHLSILVEQFTALGRVGLLKRFRRGSFVGGLVQEPETLPLNSSDSSGGQTTGWSKGVRPLPRVIATSVENLIADTLAATHRLQASVALGKPVDPQVGPVLALQLDAASQALLRQVHEISDRVITIDRHLGVDFFDTPSTGAEPGYLLDFAPEFLQEERQRIVLTTRNTQEIEGVLSPMLNGYGIHLRAGDEVMVLEGIRSLSGRLALRLQSSTTSAQEVVGLLFARWLMEEIGTLENRIVLPLDAHRSWFQGPGAQRRADLLLVGFPGNGVVRMDVIEVKLRENLPPSARRSLYHLMCEQIDTTEERLRTLFDPNLYTLPRADLALRAKELAGTLSFYVRRAVRYGLLTPSDGDAALAVAECLDDGYRLDVGRMGIVFERLGSGYHIDEDEPGFTVHRFGANKARKLFHAAMGRFNERSLRGDLDSAASPSTEHGFAALIDEVSEERLFDILRAHLSVSPLRKDGRDGVAGAPLSQPTQGIANDPPAPRAENASNNIQTNPDASPQMLSQDPASSPSSPGPDRGPINTTGSEEKSSQPDTQRVAPDVLLGSTSLTPQFGVLGRSGSQSVAIDLNGCNTISLFGVQGFGKSYTLGVIAEMASTMTRVLTSSRRPLQL